jgi:hypothetical protein
MNFFLKLQRFVSRKFFSQIKPAFFYLIHVGYYISEKMEIPFGFFERMINLENEIYSIFFLM